MYAFQYVCANSMNDVSMTHAWIRFLRHLFIISIQRTADRNIERTTRLIVIIQSDLLCVLFFSLSFLRYLFT